jgi:inorganic pyrophosphatase
MHAWHDIYIDDDLIEKELPVVIEVPMGSNNKYELDKETGFLRRDDGDPLDALVLGQEPLHPLTMVNARSIGVMRMRDEKGIDDKIIAVSTRDPAFNGYRHHSELPDHTLKQIRRFFQDYKLLENKQVEIDEFMGPQEATSIVREALDLYRRLRRGELSGKNA